jgi:hypothetical protein
MSVGLTNYYVRTHVLAAQGAGGYGVGMFSECAGEAAQGAGAAGSARLAFEPGHSPGAYPGLVGEGFLGQASVAAQLP